MSCYLLLVWTVVRGMVLPADVALRYVIHAPVEGLEPSRSGFGDQTAQPTLTDMAEEVGVEPTAQNAGPD